MKPKKFKWYKWRQMTSSSLSKWAYILVSESYISSPNGIKELLDNKGLLCTWSEHFRRVEVKPAYDVPMKVIVEEILKNENKIKDCKDVLDFLRFQHRLQDWLDKSKIKKNST
jgi:hypothetical protein